MENIISVSDLSFGYDSKRKVLENINFQLKKGESVGLVGANGVGKSTLLRILVGLNTGFQGDVMVNNIPLEKKNLKTIRKNIGYVFQDADSQLFMSTVFDDVAFAPRNYGMSEAEVNEKTMEALKVVHIEQLKDKQIYKLSGGEKKLASIATILSTEPDVILMDEPSVALDPKNRRNLINILNRLNQAKIIASHDLNMIMDTCERTILLSDGKIIKDGNTKEILLDKELMEESGLELPLGY
ncbi:energy-coupling factor ABC transporter ATP-binding protein [Eubacterium ventriosum]|uniref:ABC transporter, ATP-binding protein n=1 Tax=Eubacterium ventriosum ATCC 27560 TaxID=411463 RepID=A5Z8K8_9FIRM|nr:ABC transporter ATP-binding protein [Eubacterium ventriosum]EDM50731.1 ABC transporter, ATP-binding protein [Eubacterium ventriosum ATCC 27560]MBT9698927.1 ATP-binding cassette domain-containing protein [Eubacterium ventriosum]UWP36946.1 energy-coupling factor ABC transporter ATP-binding protein [Eubacterium ventriosum]